MIGDCYGDGNVYRGRRGRNSETLTVTLVHLPCLYCGESCDVDAERVFPGKRAAVCSGCEEATSRVSPLRIMDLGHGPTYVLRQQQLEDAVYYVESLF